MSSRCFERPGSRFFFSPDLLFFPTWIVFQLIWEFYLCFCFCVSQEHLGCCLCQPSLERQIFSDSWNPRTTTDQIMWLRFSHKESLWMFKLKLNLNNFVKGKRYCASVTCLRPWLTVRRFIRRTEITFLTFRTVAVMQTLTLNGLAASSELSSVVWVLN